MARLVRDYALSLTLAAMFLVSWLVQTFAGWFEFVSEQREHQQEASAFGPDGYIWMWLESTFENWQSEFLQLFTMAVLTAFLIHKGSSESKDGDDELMLQLTAIRAELAEIKGKGSKA
ncbi:MAG: hypothetical protein M3153_09945 [Chloroflexota bacterium]|nr:hypothetical protein [Chloroflexota bacterium]